jgi:hypothetical protein
MEEAEEEKKETPDSKKQRFMSRYGNLIEKDFQSSEKMEP